MKLLLANQATATKRRVFFFCVDATDGLTPEPGEVGGQPQISTDGAAWTNVGIGVLVDIGSGHYYAELDQAAVATAGTVISTRYKSANTAEAPGTTVQVIAFNPDTTFAASVLDAAMNDHLILNSVGEALAIIRGLTQCNYLLDNATYDGNGDVTTARIRVFQNKADTDAGVNPIATMTVASTMVDGLGTQLKVTRNP